MVLKRGFITSEGTALPNYDFKISTPLLLKEGEDFNIAFYEGIVRKNPVLTACLMYLANAYTAVGMYEKGLEIDKRLSRLLPDDPLVIYNLACSYSLTNDIEMAISTLKRAIDLGYNDIEHLLKDKDLKNIRRDERYKNLINNMIKSGQPSANPIK